MEKMLSKLDIDDIIGENIPVISSADLYKVKSLDELFQGGNKLLLLYQTNHSPHSRIGHWTGLLKTSPNDVSFYDSYGTWPDDQYMTIPFEYRKETNQTKRYLSNLLCRSYYKNLHYSPHIHQEYKPGINTCGRHVGMFLKLGLEPELYNEFISKLSEISGKTKDEVILDLTN